MSAPAPSRRMLWLAAGFAVWSSAFVILYGLHALGCAFGWPGGLIQLLLWAVLLLHLAALGLFALAFSRMRRRDASGGGSFLADVTRWTLFAALAAMLLNFIPGLVLTTCL